MLPTTPTSPSRPPSSAIKASPLKGAARSLRSPATAEGKASNVENGSNVPTMLRSKKELLSSINQLNVKLKKMVDGVNKHEEELRHHIQNKMQAMLTAKEKYKTGLEETFEEQTKLSSSRRALKKRRKVMKRLLRDKTEIAKTIETLKNKNQLLNRGHNHILSKLDLETVYTAMSTSENFGVYEGVDNNGEFEDSVERARSVLAQNINELRSRESLLDYAREMREAAVQEVLTNLSSLLLQKKVLTKLLREEMDATFELEEALRMPALKLKELSDASRAELLRTREAVHSRLDALCDDHDRARRRMEEHMVEEQRRRLERRRRGEPARKDYDDLDRIVAACVTGRAAEPRHSEGGSARRVREVAVNHRRQAQAVRVEPWEVDASALGTALVKVVFSLSQQVGELQRLKAQAVAIQDAAVQEAALLVGCCHDLDRRGLADAYWSRRPPPIDLNGPNPAHRVTSRLVECSGGVEVMQLLLEDHAIYTHNSAAIQRLEGDARDLFQRCLLAAESSDSPSLSSSAAGLSGAVRTLFEESHLSDLTGVVCAHGVPRRQSELPQTMLEQLFDPAGAGTVLTGASRLASLGYQSRYIKGIDLRDSLLE